MKTRNVYEVKMLAQKIRTVYIVAMEFRQWLSERGDDKVSALLGVSRFTVRAWRLGTRSPRPEQAKKMAMIDPAMTLDVIYERPSKREDA